MRLCDCGDVLFTFKVASDPVDQRLALKELLQTGRLLLGDAGHEPLGVRQIITQRTQAPLFERSLFLLAMHMFTHGVCCQRSLANFGQTLTSCPSVSMSVKLPLSFISSAIFSITLAAAAAS